MALKVTPASALDFLDVHAVGGGPAVRHRRLFGLVARMVADSEAITIRDEDGRLCLVAGVYEDESGAEAWFGAGEALSGHLLATLRLVAEAFNIIGERAPGLEVVAHVHPRSVAGDRLARLLGFTADGVCESAIGSLRTWRRRL